MFCSFNPFECCSDDEIIDILFSDDMPKRFKRHLDAIGERHKCSACNKWRVENGKTGVGVCVDDKNGSMRTSEGFCCERFDSKKERKNKAETFLNALNEFSLANQAMEASIDNVRDTVEPYHKVAYNLVREMKKWYGDCSVNERFIACLCDVEKALQNVHDSVNEMKCMIDTLENKEKE